MKENELTKWHEGASDPVEDIRRELKRMGFVVIEKKNELRYSQ